jgi:hypothetical protein
MIKKLLLAMAVLMSVNAMAQLTFDTKFSYLEMEPGLYKKCSITLTNSGNHDVEVSWRKLNSTMKDFGESGGQWNIGYCDCIQCYFNEFDLLIQKDTCPDPMTPGQSIAWYITIDPGSVSMRDAIWEIEVFNHTDSIFDTLTYFVTAPNSVKEVTYNANVTSYPNPVNTELMVNYELTNVSAPVLNVYSIVGVKIGTYTLNTVSGLLNVNTSDLENGMYFYSIEEKGQRVFTQRFNVVH